MVCRHCVDAVSRILDSLGLTPDEVGLGYAVVPDDKLTDEMLTCLDKQLAQQGFVRIANREDEIVQQIKQAVIDHVRSEKETCADKGCKLKLSACIEEHIGIPYDTLSRIFSARQGRTIEKFAIAMRVEWVKELLSYGNLTVAEIAYRTGYYGTAHLSRQFKAVTGLTPTQFVAAGAPRLSLSDV